MNAIETRGLRKVYGPVTALEDLNLTVAPGERYALLGVNGAGKTTAIRILTGLTAPTAGEARILGVSVTDPEVKRLVALSPQETAVAPRLTVEENLTLLAGLSGAKGPQARARTEALLRELELGQVAKRRAGLLSGGWQRRLSVAMALVTEPQVLFLDEPTLGLDVLARRELWQVIRKLPGTVILTTHYLEEAQALAGRIGILAGGRLRAQGTPAELMALAGTDSFEEAFITLAGGTAPPGQDKTSMSPKDSPARS